MEKRTAERFLRALLYTFFITGVVLLILPFTVFSTTRYERQVTVEPERPDGSRIPNLKRGDDIEVQYQAEAPVEVFVVEAWVAEEYRAHQARYNYWGDDILGEPAHAGRSGHFRVTTNSSGDWTVFFRNDTTARGINVTYTIRCPNHSAAYFFLPLGGFSVASATYILYTLRKEEVEERKRRL